MRGLASQPAERLGWTDCRKAWVVTLQKGTPQSHVYLLQSKTEQAIRGKIKVLSIFATKWQTILGTLLVVVLLLRVLNTNRIGPFWSIRFHDILIDQ
jgi:hypothetical protein